MEHIATVGACLCQGDLDVGRRAFVQHHAGGAINGAQAVEDHLDVFRRAFAECDLEVLTARGFAFRIQGGDGHRVQFHTDGLQHALRAPGVDRRTTNGAGIAHDGAGNLDHAVRCVRRESGGAEEERERGSQWLFHVYELSWI
ncbi:hypothetical protein D3C80_1293880 [compost metagenome]